MKDKFLKASLIAAFVSSISVGASAANLVDVEGSVTINRAGNVFPATNNIEIQQGDIVSVYEGSARLSTCSAKIEMNQAVEISKQACPAVRDLTSSLSNGDKVTLTAEGAAAGSLAGVGASTILIGAAVIGAVAAMANNSSSSSDNTPVSP